MSDELKLKMVEALTKGHLRVGQLIFEVKGDNYYYEDRSKEEEKKDLAPAVLSRAISEVQPFFWGISSYAVVFCVCRDCFNYPDNMSQFERELASLSYQVGLKFLCSEGTISNTLKANPYMKLPVDKWEANGAKGRVLMLRDEFVKAVEKNRTT